MYLVKGQIEEFLWIRQEEQYTKTEPTAPPQIVEVEELIERLKVESIHNLDYFKDLDTASGVVMASMPLYPAKEGFDYVAYVNLKTNEYMFDEVVLPPPTKTEEEQRFEDLEQENTILKAKTKALEQNTLFLEDCLIEIAGIVYA